MPSNHSSTPRLPIGQRSFLYSHARTATSVQGGFTLLYPCYPGNRRHTEDKTVALRQSTMHANTVINQQRLFPRPVIRQYVSVLAFFV